MTSLPSKLDERWTLTGVLVEDDLLTVLSAGRGLDDGERIEVMSVREHNDAMHQIRRFREYERWDRVSEAAQAVLASCERLGFNTNHGQLGDSVRALRVAMDGDQ